MEQTHKIKLIEIFTVSFEPYNICQLEFPAMILPSTGLHLMSADSMWEITGIAVTSQSISPVDILYENSKRSVWDCSLKRIYGQNELINGMTFLVEQGG